ncbi:MAG: N-acetylmuramoyl-L-alanine amidase [Anaerolineales bacterium]|nr:N-acetylmuramoyl-L-alanine amidase [Anaerolineales bacterium]
MDQVKPPRKLSPASSESQAATPARHLRLGNTLRAILSVMAVGVLAATLFTTATPAGLLSGSLSEMFNTALLSASLTETPEWPTPTPRPRPVIGLVAGHSGGAGQTRDPGAVCPPELGGVHEVDINETVAALTKQLLATENYDVDILEEFDPALQGYRALVLVSIHSDSCAYIDNNATGFKIAASLANTRPERTARLLACLNNRYAAATGLGLHNSVTDDMTLYHAFDEIDPETPAVIIEVGFMNLDNELLTQQPERVAQGIANGILCYLRNEDVSPTPTGP